MVLTELHSSKCSLENKAKSPLVLSIHSRDSIFQTLVMKCFNCSRVVWLRAIAVAGLLLSTCACPARNFDKPNVLFILADDFRPDCIAASGNPHIQTPNL